ncbi:hypothetical protein J1N09_06150 [Aureitalea sp. L0-47]|uniref:hypothetical protein n=1 Tax=Aureitalea sp. L0-47 TaxID=2816962 RepID=UPI002238AF18|nr:hypothetical protein [Aureitalea sp. L0-47]MCW5519410.1 hypothetical protein [Aureitalea sp. L0-47]
MESDIKLLKRGTLQFEGNELFIQAHDIKLDSPKRRQGSGHRRAMVHNTNDGLTINFNGDYPGGVTIKGKLFSDALELNKLRRLYGHTSLVDTISAMKREIDTLKRRIDTLERR